MLHFRHVFLNVIYTYKFILFLVIEQNLVGITLPFQTKRLDFSAIIYNFWKLFFFLGGSLYEHMKTLKSAESFFPGPIFNIDRLLIFLNCSKQSTHIADKLLFYHLLKSRGLIRYLALTLDPIHHSKHGFGTEDDTIC